MSAVGYHSGTESKVYFTVETYTENISCTYDTTTFYTF